MKHRTILLMIFLIGIFGLTISSPPLQGTAILGDDFKEDFEGLVYPEWETTGLWHLEDNTTSDWPINTWIPSNSHYMWYGSNKSGNYDTSASRNNGTLISEQLDLTVFSGDIELGFWSWAITEADSYDLKNVSISPDGGNTWKLLGYVQNTSDWHYFSFDITAYGFSSNAMIRFYLDTVDGAMNFYRGWMIDDIEIKEKPGYFELFIYHDNYALMGETRTMNFSIHSYFNYGIDVNVSIILTNPSGYNETLEKFYSEYLLSHGQWNHSLNYKFQEEGYYEVSLILVDDMGFEWKTDNWWKVETVDDSTTPLDDKETDNEDSNSDGKNDDQITPGFEGIFIVGTLAVSTILIRRRRK